MTNERLTAKSAVNMMLMSIGERPVNDLSATQRLDVLRAVSVLNEVNLLVQSRGWWFNTDIRVTLSPNADGEYEIPEDVLRVDPTYDSVWKYVQRGRRLYNTDDRTYTDQTDDLYVDYVLFLEFDDLPETAKMYIARRAGAVFQTRSVGSQILYQFTTEQAAEAWALLQQEEVDAEDANLTLAPGLIDVVYLR